MIIDFRVSKFKRDNQVCTIVVVGWIPVVGHHFLGFGGNFFVLFEHLIEFSLMAVVELRILSGELGLAGKKFVGIAEHHFIIDHQMAMVV